MHYARAMTRIALFIPLLIAIGSTSAAQNRRPSHCIAIADAAPGVEFVQLASLIEPPKDDFTVRIRYVDHAMFLIQTAGGLSAATDYTGFLGAVDFVPDVATMNNAHDTHWTVFPDDRIPHLLEGWGTSEAPREHYVDLGEMLVRNVQTDTRGFVAGSVRQNGNSIFVFEVAGLCIGHLGHLHHVPDDRQFAALGRLDVVMAAVDGGVTLDLPRMIAVLDRLKSSIVIPMHWFGPGSLDVFLQGMKNAGFGVRRDTGNSLDVSLRTLPSRPTVVVLRPQYLRDE